MRSRILFLPEFQNPDQVRDVLSRAAFHLAHLDPESLTFLVDPEIMAAAEQVRDEFELAADFDPAIDGLVARVAGVVAFSEVGSMEADRADAVSDVIAVWDEPRFDESQWAGLAATRTPFLTIFNVDANHNRLEASEFALLAQKISNPSIPNETRRFRKMVDSLGSARDVYVFGSGPSISEAMDREFPTGIRIVCNTVILDRELMDHVRPQILTFADPIFHFGPSIYGAEFRAALSTTMATDKQLWVVVPLRYRALLVDLLPDYQERIIGIPQLGANTGLVLDINERFGVKSFPNILSMLMLPLAATLGSRIGLIGFDGREPGEDYFWKHGERVQLHDDLPAIKRIHPGFFNLDYEDYYSTHLATLEHIFEACEARGIVVEGLSHSFMPCLVRRMNLSAGGGPTWETPAALVGHRGTILVSVDPDWMDDFGHHGPWFKAIADVATEQGVPAVSLASRAIYGENRDDVLATFSYPSINPDAANIYAPLFESELRGAVEMLLSDAPDADVVLSFYTADFWHLAAMARLAALHPGRIRAAANLMRAHGAITKAAAGTGNSSGWWRRGVRQLIDLAGRVGVTTTADTDELATLLADICGTHTPVWPMATASTVEAKPGRVNPEGLTFYCPAQSQESKGILEFTDAASRLISSPRGDDTVFQMRSIEQPARTNKRIVDAIEAAAAAGVQVLEGALSDEEYAEAIERSDVVVIPYRTDPFRTRTSSVVVDAMRAAKPVVIAAGTWGASVAESAGSAVVFRSGDSNDLARAMGEVVNRYESLSVRAAAAAARATEEYAMGGLVGFLTSLDAAEHDIPDDFVERLGDAEAILAANREGMLTGRQDGRDRAAQLALRAADLQMKDEAAISRIEELGRAITDRDGRYARLAAAKERLQAEHRELGANVRDLKTESHELQQEVDALGESRMELLNRLTESSKRVKGLEQRLGNRLIGAVKRRMRR